MAARTVPDRSIRICADRGGTFCDVHASFPDPENAGAERREIVVKLRESFVSSPPSSPPLSIS